MSSGPKQHGSTYTLYDPKTDELAGIYLQVAMQQNFAVAFVMEGTAMKLGAIAYLRKPF